MKLDMEYHIAILQDFWWGTVNTCCFATLKMSYGFNCFYEGRVFVKLLLEWKLRNVMDGSVLHIVASTEEALEVLRPVNKDGSTVHQNCIWECRPDVCGPKLPIEPH